MVSRSAEKYLLDILQKAVKHGDSTEIQNVFKNNNFAVESLNVIISKVGDIIYSCQSNLPGSEITIQNILKILLDLIQVTELDFTQSLYLTRLLLNIATDQSCTINIVKGAIPAVNHFLQNSSITQSILNNESLEGTIQILGRSIPYIGDYECQALLLETLYRITENGNRRYWAKVWFQDMQTRSLFLNMNPNSFEQHCRRTLNYINRKEVECRVFSFVAKTVKFGDIWLGKPHDCDFWIDINYDSRSMSFFCADLGNGSSESWDTILIRADVVEEYLIKDHETEETKELLLTLNCECNELICSSEVEFTRFKSKIVKIELLKFFDIQPHLEKIYGNKLLPNSGLLQRVEDRKVSGSVLIVQNRSEDEMKQAHKARKISHLMEVIQKKGSQSKDEVKHSDKSSQIFELIQQKDPELSIGILQKNKKRKISDSTQLFERNISEVRSIAKKSTKTKKKSDIKELIDLQHESEKIFEIKDDDHDHQENECTLEANKSSDVLFNPVIVRLSSSKILSGNETKSTEKRSESSLKQQIVPESQTSTTKGTTKRKQTKENENNERNSPIKKSRKAALTAIKRNREILKDFKSKKTSEKNSGSVYNLSSSIPGSEKDHLYTPPRIKKFKRYRKVFQTDTETGSSEVSWFGKGKSIVLFETPKKRYSNRKKNSKNPSFQSAKQKHFNKLSQQRRVQNNNTGEQAHSAQLNRGLKRTVSSDIENYSLVIEKVSKLDASMNAKTQNHQGLSFSSNQILTAAGLKQESPISRNEFGSNLHVNLNILSPSQPIKVMKFDVNTPKSPTKNIVRKDLPMNPSRIKTALNSKNCTLSSRSIKSFTSIIELKSKHQNSNHNMNKIVVEQSSSNDIKQSIHVNEPLSSISLSSKKQVSNVKKNTVCTENEESGGKELLFDSGINVTMCNGSQKGESLSSTEDIAKGKNFLLNRFLENCLLEQAEVFSENSSENRRATENSCIKRRAESSKSCYSNIKKLKCALHCSSKLSLRKKNISNSNWDAECLQDGEVELGKASQMHDSGMELDYGTHEFHNTNERLTSTPIKKTGNFNTKHVGDIVSDLSAIISESVPKSNKSKNKPYKNTDDFSSNQNFKQKLQNTIFSILTMEINYLVKKLLGTEQNSEYILHEKMLALRKKLVTTGKISSSGHQEKTACDQFLNSFERIKSEVINYLKSEEEYKRRLRRKHEKALEKYFCSVKMVIESAMSSVEEKILSILKHSFRKCVEIMHSI